MIHVIKRTLSDMLKGKRSSIVNIAGLSIGFAVLMTIVFFIRDESSYNMFHDQIENIYVVRTQDHGISYASVPAFADALRTEYPEVRDAALFQNDTRRLLFDYNSRKFYEEVKLAESNLFDIFSFPLIKGSISEIKDQSKIMAISRRTADKYFGDEDPIGKSIKIDNGDFSTVVAVFENIPSNSSIQFDVWMPVKLLEEYIDRDYLKTWYNLSFSAYVLLNENVDIVALNKKLENRIQQSNPGSTAVSQLYPFSDLYLKAYNHDIGIRMMSLIAFVILTLVCINFINLQTAEAFERIKNFGLMKINGASNATINRQLIVEALIYCLVAFIIGIGLIRITENYLFDLLGKTFPTGSIISGYSLIFTIIISLLIAFLAGFIPGVIIRSVSLQNAIGNKVAEQVSVKKLRMSFLLLQFCISIVLLISLFATNKQLGFLRNKDLGFEKSRVMYVNMTGQLREKRELLRNELLKYPSIINASLASRSPVGIYWNGSGWKWDGKPADFDPQITYIETDFNFQKTFEIEMLEGTYFDQEHMGVVINETFAKMMDPDGNAVNKLLWTDENSGKVPVIGIIKDIHFKPLNSLITPLMILPPMGYDEMYYLFLKLSSDRMDQTLAFIEKTVTSFNPDFPYEYSFLDDDFNRLYVSQERLRNQMLFFSIAAIFISFMGLFGIVLFILKRRTKEIGIRKVNGAMISEVMVMLNRDFVKWVGIAFVVALPIGYYAMTKWLQSFAYRTDLSWWIFAAAGLLALGIALLTVSWQSYRAASRNPVEALRYE